MTILVLGAAGNTGREVVRQLKQNSFYCKVFVKDKVLAEPFHLSSSHIFEGDFNDVESLTHAMEGIHSVYFAMPAHPDNETWTRNVLQAMSAQHVNHLVKLSGLGANAQSGSAIIRTHALTDELVKASGINYTLLQPNSFFQNLLGDIDTIKTSQKFYLPLADAKQSVIDIRDVAAVAVCALTQMGHKNKTYQLTGPESLSFAEQASILSAAVGYSIDYVPISREDAETAMKAAGINDWLAQRLAEIMAWFAEGDYSGISQDVATVLGRPPRQFEAFAKEVAPLFLRD